MMKTQCFILNGGDQQIIITLIMVTVSDGFFHELGTILQGVGKGHRRCCYVSLISADCTLYS